ncbi:MAG: protein translocase subunit SecF, partial [Candidatus Aminicenantes bacterium]|nr:protein translocase subunit SecF [Candidatus Aminicenantes bacterium]
MRLFKTPNINFMKYRFIALAFSAAVILAGILNLAFGQGFKFGVDFRGGTLLRILFAQPTSVGAVRQDLRAIGLGEASIQEIEKGGREFQIRTQLPKAEGEADLELEAHEIMANRVIETLASEENAIDRERGLKDLNAIDEKSLAFLLEPVIPEESAAAAEKIARFRKDQGLIRSLDEVERLGLAAEAVAELREKTYLGSLAVLSRETVGPQVGADLRKKATLATIWALVGMLAYITLRFKV